MGSWRAFYVSNLQSVWLLLIAPAVFLVWRLATGRRRGGALPAAAGFVDAYVLVVALETMLDPIATGPLPRALGIAGSAGGTALQLLFVLLGDFRVYLLVFAVAAIARAAAQDDAEAPHAWRGAIVPAFAWTLLVPLLAWPSATLLRPWSPALHPNTLWLVYELLFAAVALALRARWVPAHVPAGAAAAFLRTALAYVALYYALWATADVLIQFAGSDIGWLLRVVPNQLYYGFWVWFVLVRFFRVARS